MNILIVDAVMSVQSIVNKTVHAKW